MNKPWLMLQWKALERDRLQTLHAMTLAAGSGAIAAGGGDASRTWSRELSKLESRISRLR